MLRSHIDIDMTLSPGRHAHTAISWDNSSLLTKLFECWPSIIFTHHDVLTLTSSRETVADEAWLLVGQLRVVQTFSDWLNGDEVYCVIVPGDPWLPDSCLTAGLVTVVTVLGVWGSRSGMLDLRPLLLLPPSSSGVGGRGREGPFPAPLLAPCLGGSRGPVLLRWGSRSRSGLGFLENKQWFAWMFYHWTIDLVLVKYQPTSHWPRWFHLWGQEPHHH